RRTRDTNERGQFTHLLDLIPFPPAIGVLLAESMFNSLPAVRGYYCLPEVCKYIPNNPMAFPSFECLRCVSLIYWAITTTA
ncbi:MAG: hypothetical protein WAM94_05415, partial [Chromatiaceae bacterium]